MRSTSRTFQETSHSNPVWNKGRSGRSSTVSNFTERAASLDGVGRITRLAARARSPDLILLDGGRSQRNAVLNALSENDLRRVRIIAAVKPRDKHSSVSHFISDDGAEIAYDPYNPAQNMLRLLRDDAHDLANRVHRDLRDMRHNYELASILPSINEAERREVLTAVGSISKIAALSDLEVSRHFRPQTAAK